MNPGHPFSQNKRIVLVFSFLLVATISFISCKKNVKWIDVDPAYSKYVEAYTTGIVSKTSSIRIQLSTDASTTHTVGQPVKEKMFELSPSVKGTATWLDARTIDSFLV